MVQPRPYFVGSRVKVKHSTPYLLPAGLPEGASGKVIRMETGSRTIEYQRKPFTISMACIDRPLMLARD